MFVPDKTLTVLNVNYEHIGQILSSTPPIVEHILKHFSVRELGTCAQVCKLWNTVAQAIKKRRHQLFCLFKVCTFPENATPDSSAYCYNPPELGEYFSSILRDAPSDPKFGLIFCSYRIRSDLDKYFLTYSRRQKPNRWKILKELFHRKSVEKKERPFYNDFVMDYLAASLPPYCKIVFCSTPCIIGTPVNGSPIVETKMFPGLAGVFFPNIPGVNIYTFPIYEQSDSSTSAELSEISTSAEISEITGIPKDKQVKCLFIFSGWCVRGCEYISPYCYKYLSRIINHYLQTQNNNFAVGGVLVDYFAYPVSSKQNLRAVGVAFTGDNIQAASVILEQRMTSKAAENQLRKLEDYGLKQGQHFAFMFGDCGRIRFCKDEIIAADAFHKIFPYVPLFGLLGRGGMGINCFPKISRNIQMKQPKQCQEQDIWPVSGTVFILISMQKKNAL